MIFTFRLLVFSFFIILGFYISLRSIKGRGFVSLIYALTLFWYTFGCRWKITVDVAASDYGHTITTQRSTFQQILSIVSAIFGMDSSGHLAGVYWQAFILNSYLFIPLGFLVYLHFLCGCGDSTVLCFSVGRGARDGDSSDSRVKDVEGAATTEKSRTLTKSAAKSILICVATSLAIEVTQELTHLGMFDINDILANSIGSCIGIGMVWLWQHVRRS